LDALEAVLDARQKIAQIERLLTVLEESRSGKNVGNCSGV
jgi:hypothetical protein